MPKPENILGQGFHTDPSRINKKGRPVGSLNRSTVARRWLEAMKDSKNPITGVIENMMVQDAMTLALIGKALKGDVNAYRELMDSSYGKNVQQIDHTSEGKSISINITTRSRDGY